MDSTLSIMLLEHATRGHGAYTIRTRKIARGTYALRITVRDTAGNTTTRRLTLRVR